MNLSSMSGRLIMLGTVAVCLGAVVYSQRVRSQRFAASAHMSLTETRVLWATNYLNEHVRKHGTFPAELTDDRLNLDGWGCPLVYEVSTDASAAIVGSYGADGVAGGSILADRDWRVVVRREGPVDAGSRMMIVRLSAPEGYLMSLRIGTGTDPAVKDEHKL